MRDAGCGNASCFPIIPHSAFRIPAFFILAILICPGMLWSQGTMEGSKPVLTASLDRDSAAIGSTVVLTLRYRLPEGAGFSGIPIIKGLENLTRVDREIGPDKIRITLLVDQLDSWKTGPLSLDYLDKEGKIQVLTTDPVSLTMLPNLGERPEEAELRPIKGIVPTKAMWLKSLPWIACISALLLIIFGLFWWYYRRRRKDLLTMVQEPPYVLAKREIEQLEIQGLFEKGQAKAFYFRFSEILRQYLETLRGFPAAEFTTEEIASCISHEQDRRLLSILRQADLVKFADTIPTPARKDEEVKTALVYIRETSPPPDAGDPAMDRRG